MTMLLDMVKHVPVQMKQTAGPIKWNTEHLGHSP